MTSNAINLQRAQADTENARTNKFKADAYADDLNKTRGFRNAQSILSGIGSLIGGAGKALSGGGAITNALNVPANVISRMGGNR